MAPAWAKLNRITPSTSAETSPANGIADSRRTAEDLSHPVAPNELAAQLEAWTNVSFTSASPQLSSAAPLLEPIESYSDLSLTGDFNSRPAFKALERGFSAPQHQTAPYESVIDPSFLSSTSEFFNPDLGFFGASSSTPEASSFASTSLLVPPQIYVPEIDPVLTGDAVPAAPVAAPVASKKKAGKAASAAAAKEADDTAANAIAIEEDKRRRNTAASARFRIKKKQREQALEQSAKQLTDRVSELEKEVMSLKAENGWLRGLIVEKAKTAASTAAGHVPNVAIAALPSEDEPSLKRQRA